jgi:hypothetical protein
MTTLRVVARDSTTIRYNAGMARGWESKAVEEQIQARNDAAQETGKVHLNRAQRELQSRREGLLLSRKRTVVMLESARDEGFRKLQQQALEHLDAEIAALEIPAEARKAVGG